VQRDPEWRNQTGAPDDPQPGNIPGGDRDTLRSANFNLGSAEGFAPDSGVFRVEGGRLEVEPEILGGDAVSVFVVDETLPSYFELFATINGGKPLAGYKSNAFLVFDYQSEIDFKFAGVNISLDKLQMGYRDVEGWHVVEQTPSQLKPNTDYNLLLALNGTTASLVVDGTQVFSHAFAPRVDPDGFRYGFNAGLVGIGADNSISRIDNVAVRVLPPEITFEEVEDFADGVADRFASSPLGTWQIADGRYAGSPAAGDDVAQALVDLGLEQGLRPTSILELEASFTTRELGGILFDRYGPEDFKFAALLPESDQVVVGHHTARAGWAIDAAVPIAIEPGADPLLGVSLKGTTVSISVDGQVALGHVFNSLVVDGDFGLLTGTGGASFDSFTLRTDDAAFREPAGELLVARTEGTGDEALTGAELNSVLAVAVERWDTFLSLGDTGFEALRVEIVDLESGILGRTLGDTVQIDIDAAGHGWFVDPTPGDDGEFIELEPGRLVAASEGPAAGQVDLLSVVVHELAHLIGLEHLGDASDPDAVLAPTLEAGERVLAGLGEQDRHLAMGSIRDPHRQSLSEGVPPGEMFTSIDDSMIWPVARLELPGLGVQQGGRDVGARPAAAVAVLAEHSGSILAVPGSAFEADLGITRGHGVTVAPSARLGARVALGDGVHVQARAVLAAETSVGPGSVIGEDARVGARARIGENVQVEPGARIPEDAVVLAGSIVCAESGEERPGRVRTVLSGLLDPIHLAAGASVATGGLSLLASGLFSCHRDRGESRTDDGPGVGLG
jgi:hypothetical protein